MAFQLLFTLEELMADSTLKLPDIIVQLFDAFLKPRLHWLHLNNVSDPNRSLMVTSTSSADITIN
jgi:hypothetical protein